MSKMHLVKKIDDLQDNHKVIHFNDGTTPLRVHYENGVYNAKSATGVYKSTSLHAIANSYHKNNTKRNTQQVSEDCNKIKHGDEVIISRGEHKGKTGYVEKDTRHNDNGDDLYSIKTRDNQTLGNFSDSDFFHKHLTEENVVGGGAIAGAGVGDQGEPPVFRKKHNLIHSVIDGIFTRIKPN